MAQSSSAGAVPTDGKFPPEVVVSEDDPSKGYITIVLTVPGMKVKSTWKGIKKINEIDNGSERIYIKQDNVSMYVKVDTDGKSTEYNYVKKLPEDVNVAKSEFKLKKEQIRLILCKKEKISWAQHSGYFMKRS